MKPVHIGVPVLRRYDLLRKLLLSIVDSTVLPEQIVVVDNGKQFEKVDRAIRDIDLPIEVYAPNKPLGVASSWNYLIDCLPEERIITNDDITFQPDSIERMLDTEGDLVFGYGYSCYLIRDSAIEKIGLFDEAISPGYAYWEDIDYDTRVREAVRGGVDFIQANAPCTVHHAGSQTNEWATPAEIQDHHRKYMVARMNYINKWAHLPHDLQHPALCGLRK